MIFHHWMLFSHARSLGYPVNLRQSWIISTSLWVPHRSGGEFPGYFSGAWKRLICWKQCFPKTVTELHTVWLKMCHCCCQHIIQQVLTGLAFPDSRAVSPCAMSSCWKSQTFIVFMPKHHLPQGLEALILEELCSKVSGRPTNHKSDFPSNLEEVAEDWTPLGLSWWAAKLLNHLLLLWLQDSQQHG